MKIKAFEQVVETWPSTDGKSVGLVVGRAPWFSVVRLRFSGTAKTIAERCRLTEARYRAQRLPQYDAEGLEDFCEEASTDGRHTRDNQGFCYWCGKVLDEEA